MPDDIRYAAYPSAKVYDDLGHQIQHVLWGDWIRVESEPDDDGWVQVRARGMDGWMKESDLTEERLLDIIFVDVGQGDGCLVVTPDDKKIVIDAGEGDNMYRYLKWRFNFSRSRRVLDTAIITHPDKDHYEGFRALFKEPKLLFRRILHNGIMEQKPKPFGPERTEGRIKYITEPMLDRAQLEAFLAEPERYGRKLYANLLKAGLDSLTDGGEVSMIAAGTPDAPNYLDGYGPSDKLTMKILGPVVEPDDDGSPRMRWFRTRPDGGSNDKGKTKNGHSVILMVTYGDVKIMLGGDLNSSAEAFLMEHYTGLEFPPEDSNAELRLIDATRETFGADIAKCCHHGSADFTDSFMAAVGPAGTVISSGDEESHAHPRCDTLGAIGRHGRGWRPLIFSTELARSTREDEGDAKVTLGKLKEQIRTATTDERRDTLEKRREKLINALTTRNVTTYGAINLRTDGKKILMASKLERPRESKTRSGLRLITKWDVYPLKRVGGGPFVFAPDGDGH